MTPENQQQKRVASYVLLYILSGMITVGIVCGLHHPEIVCELGNVKLSGYSLVTLYINYMYEMNEKTFEYLINLTFTVFNPQECWLIGIPIVAMLSTILKVSQAFLNTLVIVTHGILEVRTFINTVWASGLMLFDTGSGAYPWVLDLIQVRLLTT